MPACPCQSSPTASALPAPPRPPAREPAPEPPGIGIDIGIENDALEWDDRVQKDRIRLRLRLRLRLRPRCRFRCRCRWKPVYRKTWRDREPIPSLWTSSGSRFASQGVTLPTVVAGLTDRSDLDRSDASSYSRPRLYAGSGIWQRGNRESAKFCARDRTRCRRGAPIGPFWANVYAEQPRTSYSLIGRIRTRDARPSTLMIAPASSDSSWSWRTRRSVSETDPGMTSCMRI